jgi:hypothetical protein
MAARTVADTVGRLGSIGREAETSHREGDGRRWIAARSDQSRRRSVRTRSDVDPLCYLSPFVVDRRDLVGGLDRHVEFRPRGIPRRGDAEPPRSSLPATVSSTRSTTVSTTVTSFDPGAGYHDCIAGFRLALM